MTLQHYRESLRNVVDNCSDNFPFVSKAKRQFVGCASHKFNLSIQDIISKSNEMVVKEHGLMKKLRSPIAAAKLRDETDLEARTHNCSRWFFVYENLRQYMELKPFLENLEIDGMDEYIPSVREGRKID